MSWFLWWWACVGQVEQTPAEPVAVIEPHELSVTVMDLLERGRTGDPAAFDQAEELVRAQLEVQEGAVVFRLMGQVLMERGHAAIDHGELGMDSFAPNAAPWLRMAQKLDPTDPYTLQMLSSWAEFNEDHEAALAYDRALLEVDPSSPHARAHAGRSLAALGRLEEAEAELRIAVADWETLSAEHHFERDVELSRLLAMKEQLGLVLMRQGRDAEAEAELMEAVALVDAEERIEGPTEIVACPFVALGVLYRKAGRDADVAAMTRRAADLEPAKVITQVDAALSSQSAGEHEQALIYARRAAALSSDEAIQALLRGLEQNEGEVTATSLHDSAVRAFERYDFDAAAQLTSAGLENAPEHAGLLVLSAFLAVLETRWDDASAAIAKAEEEGAGVWAGVARGHVLLGQKRYAEAEELLSAYRGLSPLDPAEPTIANHDPFGFGWLLDRMSQTGLGWSAANQAQHERAITHFDAVLSRKPSDLFALLGKGNSLNALGDFEGAEALLERVLTVDPDNQYALAELALVKLNQGDDAAAEERFQAALAVESETYTCPYEGLGLVYLRQGKLDDAQQAFERAIAINPDIEYKKFNELARMRLDAGRLDEAQALLEKSIENHPYDDEARQLLLQVEAAR